jgi:tetratricopeptide (TPR) repeat protein
VRGSRFFNDYNGRPLEDRRTHLVVNDARNHLLVTDQKYDVIISEPSNPWIPGAANLFTRDFFEISKGKLQPDGIFCQWIQLYELQESHFHSILRTFTAAFPEVHVFRVKHDAILVASMQAHPLRESELRARLASPSVERDLARIRIRSVEDLLAWYWIGGSELKRAIRPAPFNTDDNMLIEFAAPLQILAQHASGSGKPLATMFDENVTGAVTEWQFDSATDRGAFWARVGQAALRLNAHREAAIYGQASLNLSPNPEGAQVLAEASAARGERARALEVLQQAERDLPKSPRILAALARFHSQDAKWETARSFAERLLAESPGDAQGLFQLGRCQFHLNDLPSSLQSLEKIPPAARTANGLDELPFYLGALYAHDKRHQEAVAQYRIFLKSNPTHVETRVQLADALYHIGAIAEAVTQWQYIGRLNEIQAERLVQQAVVANRSGRLPEASWALEQAVQLDANNADLVLLLAREKQAQGNAQSAIELLRQFDQWHPDRPKVVGYLSQLLLAQNQTRAANLLASRYRALTGESWQEIPEHIRAEMRSR